MLEHLVLFYKVFNLLLHVASFLFALFTTQSRAFSIFEQSVLFGGEELAHADQLLLRDLLDINCEVSYNYDVWVIIVDIRVLFPTPCRVIVRNAVR